VINDRGRQWFEGKTGFFILRRFFKKNGNAVHNSLKLFLKRAVCCVQTTSFCHKEKKWKVLFYNGNKTRAKNEPIKWGWSKQLLKKLESLSYFPALTQ
jgi:hypothetical protein